MHVEKHQSLLKTTAILHLSDVTPSISQSMTPVPHQDTFDLLADDDVQDTNMYQWQDLVEHQIDDQKIETDDRQLADISSINKIFRHFHRLAVDHKRDLKDDKELEAIAIMRRHLKMMADGLFAWQRVEADIDAITGFTEAMVGQRWHAFDCEMVDHRFAQLVSPLPLISQYLRLDDRAYGDYVYDKVRPFHGRLLAVFLQHHLLADFRFHARLTTSDLGSLDPHLRVKIRSQNTADDLVSRKYCGPTFDLKKFIYMLLELYFPNVSHRYIAVHERLHPQILAIVLAAFELGLFTLADARELAGVLLVKLELLLALEHLYYKDFADYAKALDTCKVYFDDCRQAAAGICLHIAVLINDQAFMDSYPLFNKELAVTGQRHKRQAWSCAYFTDEAVDSLLSRVMAAYLCIVPPSLDVKRLHKTMGVVGRFFSLVVDTETDVFLASSQAVDDSLLDYYCRPLPSATVEKAADLGRQIAALVDLVAFRGIGKRRAAVEAYVLRGLQAYTDEAREQTRADARFKHELAMRGVPGSLLALLCGLLQLDARADVVACCGLALTETCKGSTINQVFATNETAMVHWKLVRESRPLTAARLLTGIFKGHHQLLHSNRESTAKLLQAFAEVVDDRWLLKAPDKEVIADGEEQRNEATKGHEVKESPGEVKGGEKGTSPTQWFEQLRKAVVVNKDTRELEKLLALYVYGGLLCDVIDDHDDRFITRFHGLDFQEIIARPFFKLFFLIVCDSQFLVEESDVSDTDAGLSPNIYRPVLEGERGKSLMAAIESRQPLDINESELRCAVFEVAMLTMKLLNKACTGLYPEWLYAFYAKHAVGSVLESTAYILDLPHCAAAYRTIIVQFYACFRIFPNDSLMTKRHVEFKQPTDARLEVRVLTSHKDGEVVAEIIKETEQVNKLAKTGDEQASEYASAVIFALAKFVKGVYVSYAADDCLESLLTSLQKLKEAVDKAAPVLSAKFGLSFGLTSLSKADQHAQIGKGNQLGPVAKPARQERQSTTRLATQADEEQQLQLASVRDLCEQLEASLDSWLASRVPADRLRAMRRKLWRPSPLHSSEQNIEPWAADCKQTGERAAEGDRLQAYRDCMADYLRQKTAALRRPMADNAFFMLLTSGQSTASSVGVFCCRLIEHTFELVIAAPKPDKGSEDEDKMVDWIAKAMLQSEAAISAVGFVAHSAVACESLRAAIIGLLTGDDADAKRSAEHALAFLQFASTLLMKIAVNKTFADREHAIVANRCQSLALLFKNLCEHNCQPFKAFLGSFVPLHPNVYINSDDRLSLAMMAHASMDHSIRSSKVNSNRGGRLQVADRPECFELIARQCRTVTELVNGPCLANQLQVYDYGPHFYSRIIARQIDDVESTFHAFKLSVIDYYDGLLEGDDSTIVKFIAGWLSFDVLLEAICDSLKRLFVYAKVQGKPDEYRKLVKAAREHRENKESAQKKKELDLKPLIDKEMHLYHAYSDSQEAKTDPPEQATLNAPPPQKGLHDFDDPRMITKEILDFYKVEDYQDIFQMYLRNNEFSKHVILSSVFKLFAFMHRFVARTDGHRQSLDDIYKQLADVYGNSLPFHVRRRQAGYQPKTAAVGSERLALFMFVCLACDEIELVDPGSRAPVMAVFPVVPQTFFLTEITKQKLIFEADSGGVTAALVANFDILWLEMEDNLDLYLKNPWLYRLSSDEAFYYVKFALWLLAFVLNILLIVYYRRDASSSWIVTEGKVAVWVFASFIVFFSLLSVVFWFLARYLQKVAVAATLWKKEQTLGVSKIRRFFHIYIKESMLKQIYPILFSFYIVCSLLGIFVQPFFFSLLLLTVIKLSTTLDYVVKAITTHIDKLALTVILMLMVMYCYALLSAEFFFDEFTSNQPGAVYNNCEQLWECVMYVFNYGLRSGGGIGDVSEASSPREHEGAYVGKFFYDVVFFMLINVIALNIIFGIIIDTFADMRERHDQNGSLL